MTDPVKPISSKQQRPAAKPAEPPKTVKIGGVTFNRDEIDTEKTTTFQQDGRKMNSVFVKPGVRIDFPDQTSYGKNPSVESRGLNPEWYNPDDSYIHITDLENATIYGAPNKSDFIKLNGESSGNEIFVDKKESWYVNGNMRRDHVELGSQTENNTVHMDEKDETMIWNNLIGDDVSYLRVEGKGESEQEVQLQESLGEGRYVTHKAIQEFHRRK